MVGLLAGNLTGKVAGNLLEKGHHWKARLTIRCDAALCCKWKRKSHFFFQEEGMKVLIMLLEAFGDCLK